LLLSSDYDPETGAITENRQEVLIGTALMGQVSTADVAKYRLENTSHKATIAMADYEANGSPELPDANDKVLINGSPWQVDKVLIGSMNQSITLFICES
jgi:hypothetical protein